MSVPADLVALHKKLAKQIDGKFCYGLPYYAKSDKYVVKLVKLGEMDLLEESEVQNDEDHDWIPFAHIGKGEPQWLAIRTAAPYAVGIWEHETGLIETVWPSLELFVERLLAKKTEKTLFDKFDDTIEKASELADKKKYPEALAALEPLVALLPPPSAKEKHDDDNARLLNQYGIVLEKLKRYADAAAAFTRAEALGESMAALNIMDLQLEHLQQPKQVLATVEKIRTEFASDYTKVWIAIYAAHAHLDLGDAAAAEKELRALVARCEVTDAPSLDKAREHFTEYAEKKGKGAAAAQQFATWLEGKSYEVSKADAAINRKWWKAFSDQAKKKLLKGIKAPDPTADATDEQIARVLDLTDVGIRDTGELEDLAPVLRFTNVKSLAFDGAFDSIEPLRALAHLERLSINNNVIKNFEWSSVAQRALWTAAENNDKKGMEKAIAAGASVTARDPHNHGNGALSLASDEKIQLWLVTLGADPWTETHLDRGSLMTYGDKTKFAEAAKKNGILPPDSDYLELSVRAPQKTAHFKDVEVEMEDATLGYGERVLPKWPKAVTLTMDTPKTNNKVLDLMSVGYSGIVVSDKVAALLRGEELVELLPVTLVDHGKKTVPGSFFILNAIDHDCLDFSKCVPSWSHMDQDTASSVAACVIDPAKVGKAQIFKFAHLSGSPVIVSKALRDKLAAFEGAQFEHLRR